MLAEARVDANGKTLAGLAAMAPFFNEAGWFWGVGFSTFEDGMHFEVADETIREWHASGKLGAAVSDRTITPSNLSIGDRGIEVRALAANFSRPRVRYITRRYFRTDYSCHNHFFSGSKWSAAGWHRRTEDKSRFRSVSWYTGDMPISRNLGPFYSMVIAPVT